MKFALQMTMSRIRRQGYWAEDRGGDRPTSGGEDVELKAARLRLLITDWLKDTGMPV